jgi:hypothetical protein
LQFLVYTLIGILLKQEQDNEINNMTNQKRRGKGQPNSGRRLQEDRRNQNEELHDLECPPDLERRDAQERRTQAERRKVIS